jgi:hypothetical protein
MRTLSVRQICLEQIWTAEGWPAASGGFGPWMGRTILPSRDAVQKLAQRFYGWLKEKLKRSFSLCETMQASRNKRV